MSQATTKQPTNKDLEDVRRHVRQHVMIAVGLAVGTILTVWTSQINFGHHSLNVAITLAVASVQAFFVAGFFMHLLSEKRMIYSFLVFTALFFALLIWMTVYAHSPENTVHYHN